MSRIFAFISGLFLLTETAFSQLNSRLDLEAGYFNIHNPVLMNEENILLRAEGELSYNYSGDNSPFSSLVSIRPEWSGVEAEMRSLKMGAQAGYYNETNAFGYGFASAVRRNRYYIYKPAISHDLLSFQGDFNCKLPAEAILRLIPAYYRQIISYQSRQTADLLSLNLSAGKSFIQGLNSEGGIYTEFFSVREKPIGSYPGKETFAPGWKIGPEVNFTYSEECIVTLRYHLLFINSRNTGFPSYEQMLRFMAAVMPEENISIMLLADYYWHKIKVRNGTNDAEASILNFSPLNYENRILLKIGYDVTENLEVYIRTGYTRQNLLNDNFSEKSWSLMFGLSLMK